MTTLVRLLALEHAQKYVGVKENPPGSDDGFWVRKWLANVGLGPGYPWCVAFVHSMFGEAGRWIGGGASVAALYSWAKLKGYIVSRPFRGDVVLYDWDGDGYDDHAGIIEKVLALRWRNGAFVGYVRTIEGNTLGGQVARRWRWIGRAKFARIL